MNTPNAVGTHFADNSLLFTITDNGSQSTSQIMAECRKRFEVHSYLVDNELDRQFPAPQEVTSRKFQKVVEADEEYKNMSANDLEIKGLSGITLRERLLMELAYFDETSQHLDIDNITLCNGSRNSDGLVPSVGWSSDLSGFFVCWYGAGYSASLLRSRVAVSC